MDFKKPLPSVSDVDQESQYAQYIPPNEASCLQPSAPPLLQSDNNTHTPSLHNNSYNNGSFPVYQPAIQPQYQSIPMPMPHPPPPLPQQGYRYIIRRRDSDDRHFPVQAAIFLLGCLAAPVWLIGYCWPTNNNRYEIAWRKLNMWMSILTITVLLVFAFLFALFVGMEDNETDPDWRIPEYFYKSFW